MLYPKNYQGYLTDLLGYSAVGARSVENQPTVSWLRRSMPIGMKNPTGGSTSVMLNSIYAAQQPQTFIFRNWEVETTGNPLAHAVLRGYIGEDGLIPQLPLRVPGASGRKVHRGRFRQPCGYRGLQPRQFRQAPLRADPHQP